MYNKDCKNFTFRILQSVANFLGLFVAEEGIIAGVRLRDLSIDAMLMV